MCDKPQRWIDQTAFGKEGNCVQAAVASILGLRLEDVPNFIELYPGDTPESVCDFWDGVEQFFVSVGYRFCLESANYRPDVLYLASGKTSRGFNHMVVMSGDDMVHDPHPDKEGLVSIEHTYVLLPIDPKLNNDTYHIPRISGMKYETASVELEPADR